MPRGIRGQQIADDSIEGVDIKDGTLTFADFDSSSITWKPPVATALELPASDNYTGDTRVTLDDGSIYIYHNSQWNKSQSVEGAYTPLDFNEDFSYKTTDDLTEGSTNKYFHSHDNTSHIETYLISTDVTYENLSVNGDVGTGMDQLAAGNHDHDLDYATITHNHDTVYSGINHDHDLDYAAIVHNHDDLYSDISHNHDADYSDINHNHDLDYAAIIHNHDADYSAITHEHDTDYSDINHNHDTDYVKLSGSTITGNIIPNATTVDLGSATNKFGSIHAQTGYFDASTVYLGAESISVVNNKISFSKGISIPSSEVIEADTINLTSVNPADTATIFGSDNAGDSILHFRIGNGSADKISFESWNGTSSSSLLEIGQADVTILGNLNITGTTTTINSATINVDDNELILNSGVTGTPALNASVVVERGTLTNSEIRWNETIDKWEIGLAGSLKPIMAYANSKENGHFYYGTTNPSSSGRLNYDGYLYSTRFYGDLYGGNILTYNQDSSLLSQISGTTPLEVRQNIAGSDAFMTFHVSGDYAVHFGLDGSTNSLAVGGWSMGSVKNKIYHDAYHPDTDKVRGVNFHADAITPTGTTRLNMDGYFYATRVYNAVYNDFADYQDLNPTEDRIYGKAYYRKFGVMTICTKRCQKGISGIASDTHGIAVGTSEEDVAIPLAVAGWVLAYVDKEYETGTALVNNKDGSLTKARLYEKVFFPERIIATYDRREHSDVWGPDEIKVDGRHWVKVI